MTVEILEILFGSKAKTRLIRFFILNPTSDFSFAEIRQRNMLKQQDARKDLNKLKKIKFVKEKTKKKRKYYCMNKNFAFYEEMKKLITRSNIFPQCRQLGKIKNIGNVKLALVTGLFLNYPKSKLDLLIVVDNVKVGKLNNLIANLEAEIGKEIRYMVIDNDELKYRLDMLDRFLLDILKNPNDILINNQPKIKKIIAGIKNR